MTIQERIEMLMRTQGFSREQATVHLIKQGILQRAETPAPTELEPVDERETPKKPRKPRSHASA